MVLKIIINFTVNHLMPKESCKAPPLFVSVFGRPKSKVIFKLGVMSHTCIFKTWEAETRGLVFKANLGYKAKSLV